jgi:Integrase core domain
LRGWSHGKTLDSLEQALHARQAENGLTHHSDHGSQYLSFRYTERLAEAGVEASVGSVEDSYDNALAETVIGLFKTEVIYALGPWRRLGAVEYATLEWVDWFNHRRLLEPIGHVPPAEFEEAYYRQQAGQASGLTQTRSSPGNPGRFILTCRWILLRRRRGDRSVAVCTFSPKYKPTAASAKTTALRS